MRLKMNEAGNRFFTHKKVVAAVAALIAFVLIASLVSVVPVSGFYAYAADFTNVVYKGHVFHGKTDDASVLGQDDVSSNDMDEKTVQPYTKYTVYDVENAGETLVVPEKINIVDGDKVIENVAPDSLYLDNENVELLDLSSCSSISYLKLSSMTALTTVLLSPNSQIERICIQNCDVITSLDLSDCGSLEEVYAVNNDSLSSLDVSGCSNLQVFYVPGNALTSINLSDLPSAVGATDDSTSANGRPYDSFNCCGNCITDTEALVARFGEDKVLPQKDAKTDASDTPDNLAINISQTEYEAESLDEDGELYLDGYEDGEEVDLTIDDEEYSDELLDDELVEEEYIDDEFVDDEDFDGEYSLLDAGDSRNALVMVLLVAIAAFAVLVSTSAQLFNQKSKRLSRLWDDNC